MDSALKDKEKKLITRLTGFNTLIVAFSGGVDSTLLLAVAGRVLGDRVIAITAESDIHPTGETALAAALAERIGVRHIVLPSDELADPSFTANPPDRCYHCKKRLMTGLIAKAEELGFENVAHGANVDDLSDHRPGFKAAQELGITAPLIDAGLTKADIRDLARQMGLPNWNRPAMACLASRIPYGTQISPQILLQIDKSETYIRQLGLINCRVRHHGSLARIEVDPHDIYRVMQPDIRDRIVSRLRQLGYAHVCLDLEGYVPGKMNRELE